MKGIFLQIKWEILAKNLDGIFIKNQGIGYFCNIF